MCTAVLLNRVREDYPLVLATNRDEFYARKTGGPTRLLAAPSTVGGLDLVAGGTWFGVSRSGLCVGLTNQRTAAPPNPQKRSRGEVVVAALKLGERAAIRQYVQTLDGRAYNAFNLFWGDAEALLVAYAREGEPALTIEEVPPGIHVLPNDRLDSPRFPKVQRAIALTTPYAQSPFAELVPALIRMLADRERPTLREVTALYPNEPLSPEFLQELSALCVRTPLYGTRASTIVALTKGSVAHYLYADGPPDETPFTSVMELYETGAL